MPVTPLNHWLGFHLALIVLLAAEFLFARWHLPAPGPARLARQHRTALRATCMWTAAALLFAAWIAHTMGGTSAIQFLAGYSIEESLSVDNLFVFLLLFRVFSIPETAQPRVLFWGVLGAILLRGSFIAAGIGLLTRFAWISSVFGAILIIAAIRLVWPSSHDKHAETARTPLWVKWIARIHPVSFRTDTFFTRESGRRMVTMLFLALIAVEAADIVFALDSIPAVLSITRQPFLAYTSNILAVMGLRSLFFLLAAMLRRLRFLHFGLAAILAFAGAKMVLTRWLEVGPLASLGVIVGVLGVTLAFSLRRLQPLNSG